MRNAEARVAPGTQGDKTKNTLVIGGIDLVIPLEVDLENDPNKEDEVRLMSDDGFFEAHLRSNDPNMEQDGNNPLLLYTFRDVPPGMYVVEVKVGDDWYRVLAGLRITKDGAFVGNQSFEETFTGSKLGTPEEDLLVDDGGESTDAAEQEGSLDRTLLEETA